MYMTLPSGSRNFEKLILMEYAFREEIRARQMAMLPSSVQLPSFCGLMFTGIAAAKRKGLSLPSCLSAAWIAARLIAGNTSSFRGVDTLKKPLARTCGVLKVVT